MKTAPSPPYLLPPEDAADTEVWRTADGTEIGERLDHWDPFTDLDLVSVVTVDTGMVRDSCQLGADSAFAVGTSWASQRTRLSETGAWIELAGVEGRVQAPVRVRIPGNASGGRLDLRTRIVLRSPGVDPSPISPQREGCILWTHETRIALEGAAARFPVAAVDFTAVARLPENASWALEWDQTDLDAPLLSGLRLLVNGGDQRLLGALRSGSSDGRADLIRSFVTFDVARSLAHAALRNERFVEEAEKFEEDSIGRMLLELLNSCWPGVPVNALVARSGDDPSRLDAELQAHLGLLS